VAQFKKLSTASKVLGVLRGLQQLSEMHEVDHVR
jgi:hypothetical protein